MTATGIRVAETTCSKLWNLLLRVITLWILGVITVLSFVLLVFELTFLMHISGGDVSWHSACTVFENCQWTYFCSSCLNFTITRVTCCTTGNSKSLKWKSAVITRYRHNYVSLGPPTWSAMAQSTHFDFTLYSVPGSSIFYGHFIVFLIYLWALIHPQKPISRIKLARQLVQNCELYSVYGTISLSYVLEVF